MIVTAQTSARASRHTEPGLQAHPPLTVLESVHPSFWRFRLWKICAMGFLRTFAAFHDSPRQLPAIPSQTGIVFLDGCHGIPEQFCYTVRACPACQHVHCEAVPVSVGMCVRDASAPAIYRSRAIPCTVKRVYAHCHRAGWLAKIHEPGVRRRAEFYYQQLDALRLLRQEARRDLLAESKKQKAWKRLCEIPAMGPNRPKPFGKVRRVALQGFRGARGDSRRQPGRGYSCRQRRTARHARYEDKSEPYSGRARFSGGALDCLGHKHSARNGVSRHR